MKRFATLATTSMFAAGLAILPVAGFAQTSPSVSTDTKMSAPAPSVNSSGKIVPSQEHAATGATSKDKTTGVTSKDKSAKSGMSDQGTNSKAGAVNHDKGA